MSASTAPDVDRVLTRMGRSAFGYRSFPDRVEELAEMAAVPTLPPVAPDASPSDEKPTAPATAPAPGGAAAPFALLKEAMAGSDATAPADAAPAVQPVAQPEAPLIARPVIQPPVAGVAATVTASAASTQPAASRSSRMRPLPPDRSRPVMDTAPGTLLADMFRAVGGREDVMPPPDEGPVRAMAFPFRRR